MAPGGTVNGPGEEPTQERDQAADRQEAAWDGTRHWLSGRRRRWNAGGRWRTAAWPPGTVPRERAAAALEQARRLRVRAWWVQNRLIDQPERRQDQ